MAYPDRKTLTCPDCGISAPVMWIVGVGPQTGPGAGPSYVSASRDGHWQVEPQGPAVTIFCPDCGAEVARRAP